MKAYARSLRIAPKKANLIAKMVRGMSVSVALNTLRRTNKKAARMVEKLLKSAVANAQHNDKQDGNNLMIKTIIVNQGAGYRRGVPMARGRMRPMIKFLSHISLTLGIDDGEQPTKQKQSKKTAASASQKAKGSVKSTSSRQGKKDAPSSVPSESSVSSVSSS